MFTLTWTGEHRSAPTVEAVDEILDQVHAEHFERDPQVVTVEVDATGDTLAIGLGRDRSALNYVSASGDPPYFTSVGESDEPGYITFRFGGDLSELPLRHSVPTTTAREVMRHFCRTGTLSPAIRWEED